MKKDHRDYNVSDRVLHSMPAEDLIKLHDKVYRKSYDLEPNPSKSHLKKKILSKFSNYSDMYNKLHEEAPTNSAGGGNIAGIGVGPNGEPGVKPKTMAKYKDKNKREAPKLRKTFKEFISGR